MKDIVSHLTEKAEKLKKERKFEEAIQITDKAKEIKESEKSSDFWYKRAIQCCELGEYEEAIECLDKDLEHHKKSYETYFLKGLIIQQLGDHEEAIECFNKAVEERNQNFLQKSKKIDYMKKAQKFEKALLYTDETIKETPLDENFWLHKGISFLKLKKYDRAIESFSNGIKVSENNPNLFYFLAKCHLFLDDEEKCIELLEKSCSIDSANNEKLKIDKDFEKLIKNKQFRVLRGL